MRYKLSLILVLLSFFELSFAQDYIDPELLKCSQKQIADYQTNIANDLGLNVDIKPEANLFVFISFSMPETSIKQWMQQATKANAKVKIRGLYKNDLKQTFAKIANLVKETKGNGIDIDPVAFRDFDIKQVPAVVLTGPCVMPTEQLPDYSKIIGNANLFYALETFIDGKQGKYAKNFLKRLRDENA